VERRDRDLERQPRGDQRHAHEHQRVAGVAVGEHLVDLAEVGGARRAVDEGETVEQRRRAERSDDQVLEAGFERARAPDRGPAQHVQRDRKQLKRDEEGDQVLRLRQQRHAQHRGEEQGLEVTVARLGVGRLGGGIPPQQRDAYRGGEDRDQCRRQPQLVEPQRPGDQVLLVAPLPDAQSGRGCERRERQRRDHEPLMSRAEHAAHQRGADPGRERDDGREPGVVDVGGGEGHR
jgi:hypothetical protein